ncbi:glycoside hydrolase family 127 protein [bacterium]|nr:glycoside hydrolase family 127 protein [bacterium]
MLNVAIKAAEYLKRVCDEKPKELASVTICPSHYMGIIDIYRATHDSTFLDLAQRLIDIRSMTKNGTDQNQDRIPFREQTEAVGHAVRANYLYAGITDVFLENGDQTLLPALRSIWEDVVFRKMYITGSTGALYDGASPDGSKDHSRIQLVHQAYGRPYQLPNVTAYNETCATIGNAFWNWRMLRMSGNSRYADVLELALYNGILSGISLEGKDYFYTNPLRVESELPFSLRWSRERQPYYGSFCCPPNIVRTIAGISLYAYGISDNAVWVNLYGANRLDTAFTNGQPIALKQSTNYPWDGTIQIEVESAETNNFEIKLRIPEWANGASISINETPINDAILPGTYCSIQRTWKQNDEIEINFPMRVKLMEAHPLVEELRNQIAIKRGPIVYCLESNDLPKEAKISDIFIPNDIDFTSRYESGFLGGITVLEGTVFLQSQTDWKQALYQEHRSLKRTEINARFIPYFSWGNRGKSEMSVWLPLQ